MLRTITCTALGLAAVGLLVLAGCDNSGSPKTDNSPGTQGDTSVAEKKPEAKPAAQEAKGEHDHKAGGHGGSIVEIGRDNFHAEAVFEKNGVVRLYTLGKDEATVQKVEAQTLTAYAKAGGATEAVEFTLAPIPRKEDAEGKTSQFVGTLPKEAWGKPVEVTVPSIRINGTRYRFGFSSVAAGGHDEEMPAKVADDEEGQLYLTPGGLYTVADVQANGNVTASQKFKGMKSTHADAVAGEKVCPISGTRPSPKFTWVVNGKPYEFCCPPCVDEFVKAAKESPASIKEPGDYLKK